MKIILTVEIYGNEICDIDFHVNYTPGMVGNYYGPTEDSYPSEPDDIDILHAYIGEDKVPDFLFKKMISNKRLVSDIIERVRTQVELKKRIDKIDNFLDTHEYRSDMIYKIFDDIQGRRK